MRWLALAIGGVATACAAVTGLSDYEITGDGADGAAAESGASSGQASSGQSSSSSGQSSGQASSSGVPPTPSGLSAYSQAACDFEKKCTPSTYGGTYAGDQDCRTAKERLAGPHGLQASAYDACAAKLRASDCHAREYDFVECHFNGPRATGTNCFYDGQCVSGRCVKNDPNDALSCGVCTERLVAGESCTSSFDCTDGLLCKSKCQKPLDVGASCTLGGINCAPGLGCISGVCTARGTIGASCSNGSCAGSLTCANGKCVEPTYAQIGQACDTSKSPQVFCARATCLNLTCVRNAQLGEECAINGTKPYCDPSPSTNIICDGAHCIDRPAQPACP